jgi:chromate transport protein ChrA
VTLGDGSATSATIHREIVDKRHWVTQSRFTLTFDRLTAGTNFLAFCTGAAG